MSALPRLTVGAKVARVTVLEDRALVSRLAELPAATGQVRLVIEGVSPVLVDKSLRVSCALPQVRVLDVRCKRELAPWRSSAVATRPSEPASAATAELERAHHQVELARTACASAREALAAHGVLRRAELTELAAAATRGVPCDDATARLAEGDREAQELGRRLVEADQVLADRQLALVDAERLATQAQQRTGSDVAWLELDVVLPELRPEVAGDAGGRAGLVGALTIEYLVPGAAWRPVHRARLADGAVQWELGACLWQRTGEDWTEVELTLSAERPSLGVELPELCDDELEIRPRTALVVQAREQEIEHAGEGAAGAAAGTPTVMGIDDGGLGLVLRPPARCSIASDGRPHRVALGAFDSDAEVDLLAIPLRSPLCHVRARFANRGALPVLAGPVDLVRAAGVVGRGETAFLASGERTTLGFGSEAEVRVHREVQEEHDEGSLLGGTVTKTVRVIIRLSNLGAVARQVVVQDRLPVSELEQIVVTPSGPEAFRLDRVRRPGEAAIPQIFARTVDEHGLVTWLVPLPPRGRAAVALEYRIKSPRGISGL